MLKWSELSPRERDALVSTEIMGIDKFLFNHSDKYTYTQFGTIYDFNTPVLLPYTTDISAAWAVVEKTRNTVGICVISITLRRKRYDSTFIHNVRMNTVKSHGNVYVTAEGSSDPEAICLAALKAVGVEIE